MGTRVLRPFNVLLYNENTTKTCFQKCKKVPARPPPDCDDEQKQRANICSGYAVCAPQAALQGITALTRHVFCRYRPTANGMPQKD